MPIYVVTQRMTYSGTDIDFAKLRESIQTDDYDHIIHIDKNGDPIIYKRGDQNEWRLDVIISESEADVTFRSWILNRRTIIFAPDQSGDPGTTHNTQIMNIRFPFAPWGEGKWRGTVVLRKET